MTSLCNKSLRVVDGSQRRCGRFGQAGQVRIDHIVKKPASLSRCCGCHGGNPRNELKMMGENGSSFSARPLACMLELPNLLQCLKV